MNSNKVYFTPNEVAEMLMVSPVTVRQWAQKGLLKASTTPGGHRRFLREDINAFTQKNGINLPQEEKSLRILIIDDDEQFCNLLDDIIRTASDLVEIKAAFNGFDAGRLVSTFQPDVVLLDLVMPALDGFTVCQQIRNDPETAHVRIIGMTGFQDSVFEKGILQAGAEICIKKPLDKLQLLDLLGLDAASLAVQKFEEKRKGVQFRGE